MVIYRPSFLQKKKPRLPTFPGRFQPSIIGDEELNYCVRDGNRCNIFAIATSFSCSMIFDFSSIIFAICLRYLYLQN